MNAARIWNLITAGGMAMASASIVVVVAACEAGVVEYFLDFAVYTVAGVLAMAVGEGMSR